MCPYPTCIQYSESHKSLNIIVLFPDPVHVGSGNETILCSPDIHYTPHIVSLLTSTQTQEAESPTTLTAFSPTTLMAAAVQHTEADSGMTAFILSRLLFENSSFTLAIVMLLVFSDIVFDASEMDTTSLAEGEGGSMYRETCTEGQTVYIWYLQSCANCQLVQSTLKYNARRFLTTMSMCCLVHLT